jgi:hypothetical protein
MSQKGKNKKDKTKEDHPSNDLQDINNLEEDENKGKGKGKNKKDKPQNPAKKLKSILENNEEIKKQIEDFTRLIIQNINENRELQNEIRKEVNKIVSSKKEFGDFSGEIFNKSATDEIESKKIEEVLRILRGDLSFKLNRFQKRGKIDMISMIKARQNNNLNMFKKKRLNKIDKSKLGVSILLDTSGSISLRDFREEIKATWCLSKALENLGNFVEVIEFSRYYRHMKKFASQGDWKRSYGSSTSVCEPLKCSISDLMVLKSSKKINNLFAIIISDGCFDENIETVKRFIDDAHKKKIKVIWICASNLHNKDNGKYFDWYIRIKNLIELSRELNKIIREIQREINKNIAQESMCLGA